MQTHLEQDFINFNFLSNTPGTAGSLSCILAGVPQRAISPFLTESSYLNTPLSTSPALTYKRNNFETHFLYGGNPGWRDINKYAIIQGFDFIEGEIEVKKTLSEHNITMAGVHDWGIYDEDLFKYVEIKLKEKSTKNKLYVIMTTTNHPPFELPVHYDVEKIKSEVDVENYPLKNRLIDKDLAEKRFRTFRYSSDTLADFISSIKKSSLKNSTVLAMTADHTSWLVNFNSDERFSKDTVPFYIYAPDHIKTELKLKKDIFRNNYGSHMDIWPTLYNLSLKTVEYESFGKNMFEKDDLSFALNNSRFIAGPREAVYVHNGDKSSFFESKNNDGLFTPVDSKNKTHEQLALKYKSLMGSLDSYLNQSKK
jgi:phosphoglycerol transferase MdoB-like AlkP superfamily enzyme